VRAQYRQGPAALSPWIDEALLERLYRWADWARDQIAAGRDYPGQASFVLTVKGRGLADCSEEIGETERAITDLPPELREVVVQRFVCNGGVLQKARACHCDRKTFGRRLELACRVLQLRFATPNNRSFIQQAR